LDKDSSNKEGDLGFDDSKSNILTNEETDLITAITVNYPGKQILWPNYPLLLKRASTMLPSHMSPQERARLLFPIHIHKPEEPEVSEFPIESDSFIGKAYIIIAKLKDSPHSFFQRKEVKFEAVFQGRFKRPIPFSRIYTGQAHESALPHIPSEWLVNVALKFITKLQPSIAVDLKGEKPYFLSPLVCTAQKIVMNKPGDEPSISYGIESIEENMALLGPLFPKMSSHKRKVYFSKKENLNKYSFNPDLMYTFDFFQHRLNLATFMIDLGFIKYDLRNLLMSRPIQIMAVEWEGPGKKGEKKGGEDIEQDWKFIYNVEIWHKRCIKKSLRIGKDGNMMDGPLKDREASVRSSSYQSEGERGEGEGPGGRSPRQMKDTDGLPSSSPLFRHSNQSISASEHLTPVRDTLCSNTGGESSVERVRFMSPSDNLKEPVIDKDIRSRGIDIVSTVSKEKQHMPYSNTKNTFPAGSGIPFHSRPSPILTTPNPNSKSLESPPLSTSRPKLAIFRRNSCGIMSLNPSPIIPSPTLKDSESTPRPKSANTQEEVEDIVPIGRNVSKSVPGSPLRLLEKPVSLVKKKLNLLSSRGKN
jgi:hypothetical protein